MSASSPSASFSTKFPAAPTRPPWYHWRRWGWNILTLSILAHVFFGAGAAYVIVQTIKAKEKNTFAAAVAPNPSTRAMEHKVQMAKKQQTMSAPAPTKRITTTSTAKIALPSVPALPKLDSNITPMSMAGMGGTGAGLGFGTGTGSTGGGTGGGALSLFGLRDSKGGTLRGTLFDFKQTPDHRLTTMAKDDTPGHPTTQARDEYRMAVTQYVQGGMQDNTLTSRYFKGPNPLYTTQVFIPQVDAAEGPKAFGLQGRVQPSRWLVHYQGTVTPPDSGTYRFVGVADDVLVVKFNGAVVLDCGAMFPSGREPGRYYLFDGLGPAAGWFKGCGEGNAFTVEAGKPYPIDILVGEWPGGHFEAFLLLRKDGEEYKKDSHGNPILPLFRLAPGTLPYSQGLKPMYQQDGPIWKANAAPPAET